MRFAQNPIILNDGARIHKIIVTIQNPLFEDKVRAS